MIDLEQNVITHGIEAHPILRWVVWWRTPSGLFQTLPDAKADAEQIEFPFYMIRSVPVALAANDVYEERP
jgi:hypothetical protein